MVDVGFKVRSLFPQVGKAVSWIGGGGMIGLAKGYGQGLGCCFG